MISWWNLKESDGLTRIVKQEQFMIICDFDLMKQGAAATGVEATTVVNYSKEQVANCIMVIIMMPMGVAILINAGFTYYQTDNQ